MSKQIWGNRIIWPSIEINHWEIRRMFTIDGYSTPWFEDVYNTYVSNLQDRMSFGEYLDIIYEKSLRVEFEQRLNFYEILMPAQNYRRVSWDFDMQLSETNIIKAFVSNKAPGTIVVTIGSLLAIEDACHTILSFWQNPLGIDFYMDDEMPRLPLRSFFKSDKDTFYLYEKLHEFTTVEEISEIININTPKSIFENYLIVSRSISRQIFADHLSLMSNLWLIGHEDAHKYCGHLLHFESLGIIDQDYLFNELICSNKEIIYQKTRRSAELQADTCATMRAVDQCFDSEFLGIITQSLSVNVRTQIWQNTKENLGLERFQRLYLLRMINISAFIPLSIFHLSTKQDPFSEQQNYPSLFTRVLNVIFTVFSRAIDCTDSHPEYGIGKIDQKELFPFIYHSIRDFNEIYQILHVNKNGVEDEKTSNLTSICNDNFANKLSKIFFEYKSAINDSPFFDTFERQKIDFGNELYDFLIKDFIIERHNMELAHIHTFCEAKKEVNRYRQNKVIEDLNNSIKNIKVGNKIFDFL